MFYSFMRVLVRILVFIINGNARYEHKERLPKGNYILVGPHRTWFDPIYFALAGSPKIQFHGQKELFQNPILRWILLHANAFSVDRNNPRPIGHQKACQNLTETRSIIDSLSVGNPSFQSTQERCGINCAAVRRSVGSRSLSGATHLQTAFHKKTGNRCVR